MNRNLHSTPCCALLAIVLGSAGCSSNVSEPTPSNTPTSVAPTTAIPVDVTPPTNATPAPVTKESSNTGPPPLSRHETDYVVTFAKIAQLFTSGEKNLKSGNGRAGLALAEADIDAAWSLYLQTRNVPSRFSVADSYLSNALREERSALQGLKSYAITQNPQMAESARASYLAAGELMKKAIASIKAELPPDSATSF